jgi:hypothetical protein
VTRVFQELGEALRQHAAAKQPLLVTKFEKPESYVRDSDLAPLRMPVAYLHRQFISEEKPLWPAPSRAAAPGPCVYHYDVFVDDADDSWIAVIFKQLDIGATEERWRKLPASETKDSALPSYEPSAFAQARRLSLATLRIGNAAAARFRLHGE